MKYPALLVVLFASCLVRESRAQGAYSAQLWGAGNYIPGTYSAAGGYSNSVTNSFSLAVGHANACSGYISIALGQSNTSSGYASIATGYSTQALGTTAFTFGHSTYAGGFASATGGYQSASYGDYSFAMGYGARAESLYAVSFGSYPVFRGNRTTWVATDPLFTVSNGQSAAAPSNAMVILKNGAVLIKPAGDVSMGTYTAGIKPDDTTVP